MGHKIPEIFQAAGMAGKEGGNGRKTNEPTCWRFNKGQCSFGSSCRFDHKCSGCGSTDHGFIVCPAKKEKDINKSN